MSKFTYPHEIDNGGTERIKFLRRVPGVTGERLEVENVVAPGAGPPMHVHYYQEEGLTIQRGRIGYQVLGQQERFAGLGETVIFKAGVAHRFWNAGEEELHCSGYIEPADNIEYFLGELFDSTKRNGGRRPSLLEIAFLARRYRAEFGVLEVPAAVQRIVFPLQAGVGRLLGKHARYADAPEPIRR